MQTNFTNYQHEGISYFAVDKIIFNFCIRVHQLSEKKCRLIFTHKNKAISNEGIKLIKAYKAEDFQVKLFGISK